MKKIAVVCDSVVNFENYMQDTHPDTWIRHLSTRYEVNGDLYYFVSHINHIRARDFDDYAVGSNCLLQEARYKEMVNYLDVRFWYKRNITYPSSGLEKEIKDLETMGYRE